MIRRAEAVKETVKNLGWRVTFAGLGINLALGILYTWSVIKKGLPDDWTETERSLPYSVACLVFCLVMVPAGRLQDKVGPRLVATVGGLLVGLGMILASVWITPLGIIVGWGDRVSRSAYHAVSPRDCLSGRRRRARSISDTTTERLRARRIASRDDPRSERP